MGRDSMVMLGLLGWFGVLALAECIAGQEDRRSVRDGDARLVTNFALMLITFAVGSLVPLARLGSSAFAEQSGLGFAGQFAIPWTAAFALTIVAQTFASYWIHRWMHRTRLLWRVHRVHHADRAVDVSTSLRNHPLELLLTLPVSALLVIAVGAPVSAVLAFQTLLVGAAMWHHADIRLPVRLDRALALAIVTPRVHRLHHNPERAVHDSNYGNLVTIWDRLFGTLNLSEQRGRVGLDDSPHSPDHLLAQIWSPLRPT